MKKIIPFMMFSFLFTSVFIATVHSVTIPDLMQELKKQAETYNSYYAITLCKRLHNTKNEKIKNFGAPSKALNLIIIDGDHIQAERYTEIEINNQDGLVKDRESTKMYYDGKKSTLYHFDGNSADITNKKIFQLSFADYANGFIDTLQNDTIINFLQRALTQAKNTNASIEKHISLKEDETRVYIKISDVKGNPFKDISLTLRKDRNYLIEKAICNFVAMVRETKVLDYKKDENGVWHPLRGSIGFNNGDISYVDFLFFSTSDKYTNVVDDFTLDKGTLVIEHSPGDESVNDNNGEVCKYKPGSIVGGLEKPLPKGNENTKFELWGKNYEELQSFFNAIEY